MPRRKAKATIEPGAILEFPAPGEKPPNAPKDVPYYSEIPELATAHDLVDLVLARQEATRRRDEMQAEVEAYSEGIEALLAAVKVNSVGVDKYRVTRAAGKVTRVITGAACLQVGVDPRVIARAAIRVDGQILLQEGVPATKIKTATEETQGKPYILVTDTTKERKRRKVKE